MRIIDVSKPINGALKLWPGDLEYSIATSEFQVGDCHGHSSGIHASLHMGTHVDAHWHYHKEGKSIDKHDLARYIGMCQVIDVTSYDKNPIEIDALQVAITQKRVLFKTSTHSDYKVWTNEFKALCPELIKHLAELGVFLVGLDTPSVDLFDSKMESHLACYEHDIYILEGLILNQVVQGEYELHALPLAIEGGDASPVRAVLIDRASSDMGELNE